LADAYFSKQPTADKDVAAVVAPCNGYVKALVIAVVTAGAAGSSTDLKEEYWVKNGGLAGAGTVQLTKKIAATDLTQTPDYLPAAGTKLVGVAVEPAPKVLMGDTLFVTFDTSGTIGTATRPVVKLIGIVMVADGNIDPASPFNRRL
jgi:hypothetical protein